MVVYDGGVTNGGALVVLWVACCGYLVGEACNNGYCK